MHKPKAIRKTLRVVSWVSSRGQMKFPIRQPVSQVRNQSIGFRLKDRSFRLVQFRSIFFMARDLLYGCFRPISFLRIEFVTC